ncbi:MAG: hypothetical protein H8M99_09355 [Gloeobacteraceae cyanobacterium ES-bin-144]|nr:hypothetical protein [Verrucomicrobiales bacterium]
MMAGTGITDEAESPELECVNESCPWLPQVRQIHDFSLTRRHGKLRGLEFYRDALRYAQSHWMAGKPAQAILQLDKAWMAELPGEHVFSVTEQPPYQALVWILSRSVDGSCGYLGNPTRHFQHLASRMSGVRKDVRSWRAWLCLHLSERVLVSDRYPRDGRQLAREGLWIPGLQRALDSVAEMGWNGEAEHAQEAFLG